MIAQIIGVALAAFITKLEFYFGQVNLGRPIFAGALVGVFLGDIQTGVILGFALELIFIGSFSVGSATSPDMSTAAVLCTGFAITTGLSTEAAIALAVPLALLGGAMKTVSWGVITPLLENLCVKRAEHDDMRGIEIIFNLWAVGLYAGGFAIITALVFFAGQGAVKAIVGAIPAIITEALPKATGMLPALGFALLIRMLRNKAVMPFFFLGFLLVAYLKIPTMGIALIGVMLALIMLTLRGYSTTNNTVVSTQAGGKDDDF
ncbi:PTS mannose/fructose/sorbose/N-acetylgalactosamine transporter subunit IIC [Caproiciproducens sp. CPB-2]|uniref:PTS mannose/fructose/sorbose/N-acetylgalactosamine transporter subunit IIC n=1 Tax=Caproiciproducens sp. CPB-2 TaxID=3030017 RepID=UPI0023D9B013|nr:PTS sugar transporter subunit IIC [Caproiciproducens sp. CPB-2]MDF1494540.1 PTS sugar transporter subunit IIC [Caproiciproducens sp. CPB-2]